MAHFAGYDVVGEISTGSTGTVYRALQTVLGRDVAIKVLDPSLAGDPFFLERFRGEARILAGLQDDHIVAVYDYVEDAAGAWIVQEWVNGGSLASVLATHGTLTPQQSLGVERGALTGLATAHRAGIVHGDVSTSNILVTADGVSMLVDFGVAGPVGARGVLGTPAFMSPEAGAGLELTPRSDVYSACAVLVTLLTGVAPDDATPNRIASMHGQRLAGVLSRGLSAEPQARPTDAAELLALLDDAARNRYGAGWLAESSVAGLTGAGVLAAAGAASTGTPNAAASRTGYGTPPAMAGQVAALSTEPSVESAPTGTGVATRGAKRSKYLAAAAGATALAAAAVVGFAVTGDADGGGPAASGESASPSASPTDITPSVGPSPTVSPAAEPAFAGTYAVTSVLRRVDNPAAFSPADREQNPVGTTSASEWVVEPGCASGACGVTGTSSTGTVRALTYESGAWVGNVTTSEDCIDDATQQVTGTGTITAEYRLEPEAAETLLPVSRLTGYTEITHSGCNSETGTVTYSWTLERSRP